MDGPAGGSRLALVGTGRDIRSVWERLAETAPSVQPTQTPAWLDCMASLGPFEDASRLYETSDGRLVVLPLVRDRRLPAAVPLEASLPHPWDYAGPLASGGLQAGDAIGLLAALSRRRVTRTTVRATLSGDPARAWKAAAAPAVRMEVSACHVLDLSGGFDTVWTNRFTSKVRSASRKAVRRGVHIEADHGERLVPAYAQLYIKSIERWAAQRGDSIRLRRWLAQRRGRIRAVQAAAATLGDACRVWMAFREGHPVAGIIVITHRDQVLYWKGAMDQRRIAGTGANELLHCRAIERACEHGARAYHMGPNVDRFKRGLGTAVVDGVECRLESLPLSHAEAALRSVVQRALRGARGTSSRRRAS